ncbi:hypothetical protein L873DRAFT_1820070 [Choiromyces venosus 120613-1]|uniref:Uncharacterized protein n=1 Tax=Choiromyces venosus 120613-1 TaxID=1336337 RepID=A0A3N4IYW7_9PEZI|nr:hypothetical protein L873DRAFT_1820070 [Choiromyces venosus 120613-1]
MVSDVGTKITNSGLHIHNTLHAMSRRLRGYCITCLTNWGGGAIDLILYHFDNLIVSLRESQR